MASSTRRTLWLSLLGHFTEIQDKFSVLGSEWKNRYTIMVFLSLIFALQFSHVFAENRVFELKITNTKTKTSRKVYSTLDELQYPFYNHLSRDEYVERVDHWMCWRRPQSMYDPLCKRGMTQEKVKELEGLEE